eukprot:1299136-Rhodomonas_salina.1
MQPQPLPAAAAAAHGAAALTTADALNIVYHTTPAKDDRDTISDAPAAATKNNTSNAKITGGDGG